MKHLKIVTSSEMACIDKLFDAETLMQKAGREIAKAVIEYISRHKAPKKVTLLIGPGNNGGDAYVAGLWLLSAGIAVQAVVLEGKKSPLNQKFGQAFFKKKGKEAGKLEGVLLDGIFGTGLRDTVKGAAAKLIEEANASGLPILAIDIPSGLDGTTGEVHGCAIVAHETIALGFAKIGFFVGEGWNYLGKLRVVDIGLSKKAIDDADAIAWMPSGLCLPKIMRKRHKYQAGYVVGLAGSKKMPGAAKLAGMAALRGGAGIVRVFSYEDIGYSPMELICNVWDKKAWQEALSKASSLFIGPGLGKCPKMDFDLPCVIDADALQLDVPKGAILTPHHGEAMRLFKVKEEKLFETIAKFCKKKEVIVVLKGAPTWVFSAHHAPFVIAKGDPGMATAGCGDVLTGLIAALLAQGKTSLDAALLGVTLHAMAGEKAAEEKTSYCMTAGDIIACLPAAFQSLL